jgi:hypothetical protein
MARVPAQSARSVSTSAENRALLAFLLAVGRFQVIPKIQITVLNYLTAYIPR